MSGHTPGIASVSTHDQVDSETLHAIRDRSSPGREAFVRFKGDDHLHRGLAYSVIQVADPGDEERVEWRKDVTGVVEFHDPVTLHKKTNIGLGSVVLAHVSVRTYAIATVRLHRQVHKNNKKTKPYQVQYLDPKLREKQKSSDKTLDQVKPMTLDSSCLLQGTSLVEAFPTLSEEDTAIREAKAKANASAAPPPEKVAKEPEEDSVSADAASSIDKDGELSYRKKRSSSPSDDEDSETTPSGKRRKTGKAPLQAIQNKMLMMSTCMIKLISTETAADDQNQNLQLGSHDYFDRKLGCQFIEVNFRVAVKSMCKSLEEYSSSIAQSKPIVDANQAVTKYKRHYADLVHDGNVEKAKALVQTDAKTTKTQLCLRQRQYNFKWDVEACEEIVGVYEKYLNDAIAIYCDLCGKQYEEKKV
ncbi:hypothetical protein AC579_10340 [Pseudocercospora musae]|uniref:Uncharacterized protein n=1 Tax=Pseudocercospora musae TaxID=113226 RepID=A0A139I9Z8_9PEZI|nr:hypothetical protein AC579_10340 [Pseudocercospora musae]